MSPATSSARQAGRPRDPDVDRLILETTVAHLVERGYDAMSIEGIAAAAGVGKTAIYRRYPGKRELVVGAISSLASSIEPPADLGDTRAELRAFLTGMFGVLRHGGLGFAMVGTLLVREGTDPELLDRFRVEVIRPRMAIAMTILRRGIERGEVRADLQLDVVTQLLAGSIFARHVSGQPEDEAWIDAVFETLWGGIAAR
jgi:AcrR family transcriptional regulator